MLQGRRGAAIVQQEREGNAIAECRTRRDFYQTEKHSHVDIAWERVYPVLVQLLLLSEGVHELTGSKNHFCLSMLIST